MNKKSILLVLLVLVVVCGYFFYTLKPAKTFTMKPTGDTQIDNLIGNLKKSMEDYLKDGNPPYSQNDIEECVSLLSDYTVNIYKSRSKKEGMQIVKSTIIELNTLNDKCESSLIETNEREQITDIIILASNKMKYNSLQEDITEEWREW